MRKQEQLRSCVRSQLSRFSQFSLAAVLLGTTANILDAVSIGYHLFPPIESGSAFDELQTQAVSLFVISTVVSQLALTFGGSRLPGVLGSMLVEVLPFLRAAALTIHRELGGDHPGVLPTTLATYATASLILGASFALLGFLRCGALVASFPQSVLAGVIGAVGVSLFVLGLEATLPAPSPPLLLRTARSVLFNRAHLPLLTASLLPALFLSASMRVKIIEKGFRGLTTRPLYIPACCLAVVAVFWIVVASTRGASLQARADLASDGWLFPMSITTQRRYRIADWNYWALFDFSMVQWRTVAQAAGSIALLVLIGLISLPVFLPATAMQLRAKRYDMNYEFFGHAFSNILAGAAGTVPNLVILSNTRFFFLAGGGQIEAAFVALFTLAFFFASPFVLPYIPTILASMLVFFFGIELLLDSLWASSKKLVIAEWTSALGTTVACSTLGFAPGIGLGLGIVVLLQFCRGLLDSYPRKIEACTLQPDELTREMRAPGLCSLPSTYNQVSLRPASWACSAPRVRSDKQTLPSIIRLTGYVSFATITTIERVIEDSSSSEDTECSYLIIYFDGVTGVETYVAELLGQRAWELACRETPRYLIIAGVHPGSVAHIDLVRGGPGLWQHAKPDEPSSRRPSVNVGGGLSGLVYSDLSEPLYLYQSWVQRDYVCPNGQTLSDVLANLLLQSSGSNLSNLILPGKSLTQSLENMRIRVRVKSLGDTVSCSHYPLRCSFIILKGQVMLRRSHSDSETVSKAHRATWDLVCELWQAVLGRWKKTLSTQAHVADQHCMAPRYLNEGDSFGLLKDDITRYLCVYAVSEPCWILDVSAANSHGWDWAVRTANRLSEVEGG